MLKDIATQVGLDGEALIGAIAEPEYETAVNADIRQAYAFGLRGVPALIFEEKYLVSGWQTTEVLTQVIDEMEGLSKESAESKNYEPSRSSRFCWSIVAKTGKVDALLLVSAGGVTLRIRIRRENARISAAIRDTDEPACPVYM